MRIIIIVKHCGETPFRAIDALLLCIRACGGLPDADVRQHKPTKFRATRIHQSPDA
jgi:hypothetical protein